MSDVVENKTDVDYDADFQRWLEGQAAFLQQKATEHLDIENLVEELQGEVKAERALASAALRLLLLTHLLKDAEPSEWWHPYFESLIMHFPNNLLPHPFFSPALVTERPAQLHEAYDTSDLKRDLQALLKQQLSQNPSLVYYLNDRLDEIFVEAGRVVVQLTDGLHLENSVRSNLGDFAIFEQASLNQLSLNHLLLSSFGTEAASRNADHYAWLKRQIALLSVEHLDRLDFENLSQEVSAIAKRDKRALRSRLTVLLLHLLKYQYQVERRSSSWLFTLQEQRNQIQQILEDSPSLQSYFSAILSDTYTQARVQAHLETKLSFDTFPEACPYTVNQVLDPDFLPDT